MTSPAHIRPRLLHRFADFYADVFRLKQEARKGTAMAEAQSHDGAGNRHGQPASASFDDIRKSVAGLLDRDVPHDRAPAEMERELRYIMAAFADETFVQLEWAGREQWRSRSLERQLFDSDVAGERIFRNIDAALTRREAAAEELATVYLAALVLGFRGKYREQADSGAVESYRRELESALGGWNRKEQASVPAAVPRRESGERQIAEALPKPPRVALPFRAAEGQLGARPQQEPGSGGSRGRWFTPLACALTAVLAFAAGAALGLLISSRNRGSSQAASAPLSVPSKKAVNATAISPAGSTQGIAIAQGKSTPADQSSPKAATNLLPNLGSGDARPFQAKLSSEVSGSGESFYLQVGSFQRSGKAIRVAQSLDRLGYPTEVLQRADTEDRAWNVVLVGPYPDQQTAAFVAEEISSDQTLGLEPIVRSASH